MLVIGTASVDLVFTKDNAIDVILKFMELPDIAFFGIRMDHHSCRLSVSFVCIMPSVGHNFTAILAIFRRGQHDPSFNDSVVLTLLRI